MKRNLLAALVLSVLASTSAFASGGGGIGRSGTYTQQWWSNGSGLSRAEVKAAEASSYGGYTPQNADAGNAQSGAAQNANAVNRAGNQ